MTILDTNNYHLESNLSLFCDENRNGDGKFSTFLINQKSNFDINDEIENISKRKVKFADECGIDLTETFVFDKSDFSDLDFCIDHIRKPDIKPPITIKESFRWVASFIQPASLYMRFKSELHKQKVKLANVVIEQLTKSDYRITGIIRVISLCFEKRVFIRLSSDSHWSKYFDYDAKYLQTTDLGYIDSNRLICDEFEFAFNLPALEYDAEESYLEFVVGYVAVNMNNQEYWDNNDSQNYRLDFCRVSVDNFASFSSTSTSSTSSVSIPSNNNHNSDNNNISNANKHGNNNEMSLSPSVMNSPSFSRGLCGQYTTDYKPDFSQYQNDFTSYRVWTHFSDEMGFY